MKSRFFSTYAEYTLETTLSEEEFRALLKKRCSSFSLANLKEELNNDLKGPDGEILFRLPKLFSSKNPAEVILVPLGPWLSHPMRGLLHITMSQAPDSTSSILRIVIQPDEDVILLVLFLLAIPNMLAYLAIREHAMLPGLFCCGINLFMFAFLYGCRALGKKKVPEIQNAFKALIEKMEHDKELTKEAMEN